MKLTVRSLVATTSISFKQVFDGNFFQMMTNYILQFIELFFISTIYITSLGSSTSFNNIGNYIILSYMLSPLFNIITPATSALWEGSIINRYTRPMPIFFSFISETIGKTWIPYFLFFSIPVFVFTRVAGVSLMPASIELTPLFILSLLLSVFIGLFYDIMFASLAIYLKEARWAVFQIRIALTSLLSGALIPFKIMPVSLAKILSILPFGSIANAPLGIYFGFEEPTPMLLIQLFWFFFLGITAYIVYSKSQERMVSFGG